MMPDLCLVCLDPEVITEAPILEEFWGQDSCIGRHVTSIFLLRSLLNFPKEECETLLRDQVGGSGHPGEWFSLCGSCSEVVENAFRLHLEVLQLERDVNKLAYGLRGKLGKSLEEKRDGGSSGHDRIRRYFRGGRREVHRVEESTLKIWRNLEDTVVVKTEPEWMKLNLPSYSKAFKCKICNRGYSAKKELSRHYRKHVKFEKTSCKICKYPAPSEGALKVHHQRERCHRKQAVKVKTEVLDGGGPQEETGEVGFILPDVEGAVTEMEEDGVCNFLESESALVQSTGSAFAGDTITDIAMDWLGNVGDDLVQDASNENNIDNELPHSDAEDANPPDSDTNDDEWLPAQNDNRSNARNSHKIKTTSKSPLKSKQASNNSSYKVLLFSCEICQGTYTGQREINRHMRNHEKFASTTCSICKFPARSEYGLQYHYKRFHKRETPPAIINSEENPQEEEKNNDESIAEGESLSRSQRTRRKMVPENDDDSDANNDSQGVESDSDSSFKPDSGDDDEDKIESRAKFKKRTPTDRNKAINADLPEGQTVEETVPRKFQCEICHHAYTTKRELQRHHNNHKKFASTTCDICKFPTKSARHLEYHHKTKHRKPAAPSFTANRGGISVHQNKAKRIPTQSNSQQCHICQRRYVGREFSRHMFHHKKFSATCCQFCKVPFKTEEKLKSHYDRKVCQESDGSVKPRTYECDKCDFVSRSRYSYYYHKRGHYVKDHFEVCEIKESGDIYHCKLCSKVVGTVGKLFVHMKDNHASEIVDKLPFCQYCSKSFSSHANLSTHIRFVHQLERNFRCDICGEAFRRKPRFDEHMAMHESNGRNPVICELCGSEYLSSCSLQSHMRKYHRFALTAEGAAAIEKKKRKCLHCGIVLLHEHGLKRHLRQKHEELYLYKCDQCDSMYMHAAGLNTHKKANHSNQVAYCQYCNAQVKCQAYLASHVRLFCKKKPGAGDDDVVKTE